MTQDPGGSQLVESSREFCGGIDTVGRDVDQRKGEFEALRERGDSGGNHCVGCRSEVGGELEQAPQSEEQALATADPLVGGAAGMIRADLGTRADIASPSGPRGGDQQRLVVSGHEGAQQRRGDFGLADV